MKKYWLTCDPGLEMVLESELAQIEGCSWEPFVPFRAKLWVAAPAVEPLLRLRSVHHVAELLHRVPLEDDTLESVTAALQGLSVPQMETARSFRVSSSRWGNHAYGSMDVMREAGAVLWRRYGTRVDLHQFDLEIRVDIHQNEMMVGIQHTPKSLAYRIKYKFIHQTPLKSTAAFGLLTLAELQPGETILDPFCGGGTLPIEGALAFGDRFRWVGSDLFMDNVEGARLNAVENGVEELIEFVQADARDLRATFGQVDVIVTDPPYGLKSGKNVGMATLYEKFIASAGEVLRLGGRLVILSPRKAVMLKGIQRAGCFRVRLEKLVETGPIKGTLFVLVRMGGEG